MIFVKKHGLLFLACIFLFIPQPSLGQRMSNDELEQEIDALKEKIEGTGIPGELSFSGVIELDYSHADDSNIGDNTVNDSSSDLDIGTVEVGLEAAFHEYVAGNFLLKGEALDSDNDRVFWDEATIGIQKEDFPFYFIGGKRGQPFGLFESHMINDPITQDCYEIAKTGATAGYTGDSLGLDISVTAYKGEELMAHLNDAGYGFERDTSPGYKETDDVNSYLGNITISPLVGLILAAYYDSEPGDGDRNETVGATVHYGMGKFVLDAEYIGALSRENHFTDNKEYKESAWFASVACQALEPLEIAVRYEAFDDGMAGDQDGHLSNRYGIGFTYCLFEKNALATNLMGEYRISGYEQAPGSTANNALNEAFLRLAIEF
jgi:hypothetical protein